MRTAQDFLSLTSKLQMDIRAANAKLTELRAWIASLDLPEEPAFFHEPHAFKFVWDAGYLYEDKSLREDLLERGADEPQIEALLVVASQRRMELES